MTAPTRILLAEDEEIIAIIIRDLLHAHGFQVTVCTDGITAWGHLQTAAPRYDVVLLDLGLPDMDGMALLRRIKNDPTLAQTPVVLETAHGDMESIRDGLTQGAYYYLTKPFQADVLIGVIKAALQQSRDLRTLVDGVQPADRPLGLLHTGSFRFRNLEEGNLLAYYLARVCPDPERTIQGMLELLVNAVEHGNLEISYAEKGALILEGCWRDEVQRRLNDPAYRNRYVEIHFRRQDDLLSFTIQDQGQGFDWNQYLEFSPERAFDLNGRGIAMAGKLSFDHLEYRGNGNTVVATVRLPDTATCPTA